MVEIIAALINRVVLEALLRKLSPKFIKCFFLELDLFLLGSVFRVKSCLAVYLLRISKSKRIELCFLRRTWLLFALLTFEIDVYLLSSFKIGHFFLESLISA